MQQKQQVLRVQKQAGPQERELLQARQEQLPRVRLHLPAMRFLRVLRVQREADGEHQKDIFENFTWYPDTLSAYPTTKAALPQILTQCGYTGYVFSRCMERSLNTENFRWKGLDGTELNTHWMGTAYAGISFPDGEKANAEECDLFVIAGDLFDKTAGIAKKTIRELLDLLCAFRGTVVVLPGNHDYYDGEAAVWQDFRREMSGRDNILLLTAFEPRTLQAGDREVVLYPAFCTSRHSEPGKNNLDWIRQQPIPWDDAFRIGLAHGAIAGETIDQEKEYFLMTREELEAIPLDAWLIGHTHVPVPGDLGREYAAAGRIFNAGTHVQKDVHNLTDGLCFLIEIGDDKQVRAKQWVSGNVFFRRLPVAVTAGHMEEEISRALKGLEADSVVELELSGAVTDEEYRGRRRFLEEALSGFLEGSWEDSGLTRLITEDLIDAEFPETSVAAGLLRSLLDDPREAQLAYDLLKSLKGAQPS